MSKAAVFLDRDGTINVEKHYLHRYEDWEWLPGAVTAIQKLNEAGLLVLVISNQAGVARGLYTEADIQLLHIQVDRDLSRLGARIDAYYYCPHHPEFGDKIMCDCRKPAPGLLVKAQKDWDIDMSRSFMVGDKVDDAKAGEAAGVKSILVSTGYGQEHRDFINVEMIYVKDLLTASCLILNTF